MPRPHSSRLVVIAGIHLSPILPAGMLQRRAFRKISALLSCPSALWIRFPGCRGVIPRPARRIAPANPLHYLSRRRVDEWDAHCGNVFLEPAALSIWATGLPGTTHTR